MSNKANNICDNSQIYPIGVACHQAILLISSLQQDHDEKNKTQLLQINATVPDLFAMNT